MSQEGGHYYVPAPSPAYHRVDCAVIYGFRAAFSVNKLPLGYGLLAIGFAILIYMMFGWFGVVAKESEAGTYNQQVDVFPLGDELVHFSEVMFFAAFFGALFYMRVYSIPWLSDLEHKYSGLTLRGVAHGWPRDC